MVGVDSWIMGGPALDRLGDTCPRSTGDETQKKATAKKHVTEAEKLVR